MSGNDAVYPAGDFASAGLLYRGKHTMFPPSRTGLIAVLGFQRAAAAATCIFTAVGWRRTRLQFSLVQSSSMYKEATSEIQWTITTGMCHFSTLFELELDLVVAKVSTHLDQVVDVFYVQEIGGGKILEPTRLYTLRQNLLRAIEGN